MPAGNPFAPTIEVGGGAQAGASSNGLTGSLGLNGSVGDHHATAGVLLLSLGLLVLLWRNKFRFSTTVG